VIVILEGDETTADFRRRWVVYEDNDLVSLAEVPALLDGPDD